MEAFPLETHSRGISQLWRIKSTAHRTEYSFFFHSTRGYLKIARVSYISTMRREVACTLLLASAAAISTTATATATGEKNIQVHLPTIPRPYPRARSFKNGPRLHSNASVNIDGREPQPCHQNHPCNDRRLASDPGARGARGGCLTSRRARAAGPLGLVQPCFLQPCLSSPVVRERGGLKVGFSTCEKPERSAMRCRRQRVELRSAKRRR